MRVFVTVGTNEAPFDRLVRAVDELPAAEDVLVQRGSSSVTPLRATTVDFLPFDSLVEQIRSANVVVSHAGVGSIMVALTNGMRPVVVPRLSRFGEAVDDHQVALARRLAGAGLVRLANDPQDLADIIADVGDEDRHPPADRRAGMLAFELRRYIADSVPSSTTNGPSR